MARNQSTARNLAEVPDNGAFRSPPSKNPENHFVRAHAKLILFAATVSFPRGHSAQKRAERV